MFVKIEMNNTTHYINKNNILRIEAVGNNKPTIYFIDGKVMSIDLNKTMVEDLFL
ncbi:hypothetical protein SAMN04488552_0218 [Christiangramia echinicola]|uniref:Uncharacterized protein n=1 Tax=Christiangramia echinicola TaxID=279359 RepID=A0A1H1KUH5_9FLAO|nr:hypothetical protein SAMN04488552_0218 [Christiangramia echinicola]